MKCLFVNCKAPVAFRVTQRWNCKTVHTCEAHVPGNGGKFGPVPNPTVPVTRGAYDITPLETQPA